MKISAECIPRPILAIVQKIKEGTFDYEKHYSTETYYNKPIFVTPLFVSYGQIGYVIGYMDHEIEIDNDYGTLKVLDRNRETVYQTSLQ
jgi:hypothetical protein